MRNYLLMMCLSGVANATAYPIGANAVFAGAVDIDGDGQVELVTLPTKKIDGTRVNTGRVLVDNKRDPNYSVAPDWVPMDSGDINGDRLQDIIGVEGSGKARRITYLPGYVDCPPASPDYVEPTGTVYQADITHFRWWGASGIEIARPDGVSARIYQDSKYLNCGGGLCALSDDTWTHLKPGVTRWRHTGTFDWQCVHYMPEG